MLREQVQDGRGLRLWPRRRKTGRTLVEFRVVHVPRRHRVPLPVFDDARQPQQQRGHDVERVHDDPDAPPHLALERRDAGKVRRVAVVAHAEAEADDDARQQPGADVGVGVPRLLDDGVVQEGLEGKGPAVAVVSCYEALFHLVEVLGPRGGHARDGRLRREAVFEDQALKGFGLRGETHDAVEEGYPRQGRVERIGPESLVLQPGLLVTTAGMQVVGDRILHTCREKLPGCKRTVLMLV